MDTNQIINDLRERLVKAESERDALASQVVALIQICKDDYKDHLERRDWMPHEHISAAVDEWAAKRLPAPTQCLAAHDAEVAKAAVLSTLRTYGDTDLSHEEIESLAECYAMQIRVKAVKP